MSEATTTTAAITGVVLAGGRGRRMGGADKGLLPLAGRPLAAHVLEALAPQVCAVLINANRNLDRYAALGVPVVADALPGFRGPLAGMLAGLRRARTDWVLFAPCDVPAFPHDLAARLFAAAEAACKRAAYAVAGDDPLYVCCLLHRSLAAALEACLMSGGAAVRDWLAHMSAVPVPFPAWPAQGRNLNTPALLAEAS